MYRRQIYGYTQSSQIYWLAPRTHHLGRLFTLRDLSGFDSTVGLEKGKWFSRKHETPSTNQSTKQPINQSTNQTTNQSIWILILDSLLFSFHLEDGLRMTPTPYTFVKSLLIGNTSFKGLFSFVLKKIAESNMGFSAKLNFPKNSSLMTWRNQKQKLL